MRNTLGTLGGALLCIAGAWAGEDVTVKLKPSVLRAPHLFISKSDFAQPGIWRGHVMTGNRLALKTGKGGTVGTITIAGKSLDVGFAAGRLELILDGKKKVQPISNLASAPAVIPLEDKRKYVIAFPLVYTYMTTANVFYRSGFYTAGKLKGKDFWLYDDNVDGVFDTFDCYQNGRSMAFAPLQKLVTNGSAIFEVGEIAEDGSSATFKPWEGETASLTIKYKGPKLHAAWSSDAGLTHTTGKNAETLTVTKGQHELLYGVVLDRRNQPCALVNGRGLGSVTVDGKTTLEFGAPFNFNFSFSVRGKNASANPYGHNLFGAEGEQYLAFEYEGTPSLHVRNGKQLKQFGTFVPG